MILLVTSELLGETPAGPGLRATELGTALHARGFDVCIAAPAGSIAPEGIRIADIENLEALVAEADVVIPPAGLMFAIPEVMKAKRLCVDHAGPFELEVADAGLGEAAFANATLSAIHAIRHADLILVTHERQRDYCSGLVLGDQATSFRATNPLERFAIVGFGLPESTADPIPVRREGPLRIGWPGGLWDWLDPDTVLDAMKLIPPGSAIVEFWGSQNPDPHAPQMETAARLAKRIEDEGLADRVRIVDWVPIREYWTRLAEFDIVVTLDPGGVEARFAFRTRLLAALRVGIPTIATKGEWIADIAAAGGGGWTIPPHDSRALADLILDLSANRDKVAEAADRAIEVAEPYAYDKLIEPLAAWCANADAPRMLRGQKLTFRDRARLIRRYTRMMLTRKA
jgi:glycosyltransferase involved in cell wall biosynthesis